MIRKNYLKLKSELKELASKIKSAKKIKKEISQAYSNIAVFRKNVTMQHTKDIVAKWETGRDEYNALCNTISEVYQLKREYRHKHITISLARGKTYEQIEPKVREDNGPDWYYIKQLKDEYKFDEVREVVTVVA